MYNPKWKSAKSESSPVECSSAGAGAVQKEHHTLNVQSFGLIHKMENRPRNAYDAAFKLKAISLTVEEGNRAASHKLCISESMELWTF